MQDLHRFLRVSTPSGPCWAVLSEDNRVNPLSGAPFAGGLPVDGDLGPVEDCRLLAPATPSKIVCVARNYVAHAEELGSDVPTEPMIFLKPPSTIIAPGDTIEMPPESQRVDWEAELAIVIGERCRRVREADAWDVIFGYTCANDVTARDIQKSEPRWTRGKGFDTFCPVGPWILTGLEPEQIGNTRVSCRVNGELKQDGHTSLMIFPFPVLIAWITTVMTLEPGDLILTGTPAGVGPMSDGDTIEVEVEGVGVLRNRASRDF